MSPDVDLTLPKPGLHPLRDALLALDSRLFEFAADPASSSSPPSRTGQ
ncbi:MULTISPECIES: hypothetical protein [unclassified Streptomyces]